MQKKENKEGKKVSPGVLKLDDDFLDQISGGVTCGKNNPGGNTILKPKAK